MYKFNKETKLARQYNNVNKDKIECTCMYYK